ncbi:SRPBCC family protein [Sphingomonas azotifigens]|uniref:SRPBCC family protein n=1 Tax=Sphingomonas azotifigens TaxID=330920 RepID=UPI0009FE4DC0|nr:SRPBCC family protein [Sphingomonas azotifigens]
MASASASIELAVPADVAWRRIGGFDALPDWLPFITRSVLSEGGRVRHLTTADGATIVERLMTYDEAGRSYSYHILEAPFPQTAYLSTLRAVPIGPERCRVDWLGGFSPEGVSEAEISQLFEGIYEQGLQGLVPQFPVA